MGKMEYDEGSWLGWVWSWVAVGKGPRGRRRNTIQKMRNRKMRRRKKRSARRRRSPERSAKRRRPRRRPRRTRLMI